MSFAPTQTLIMSKEILESLYGLNIVSTLSAPPHMTTIRFNTLKLTAEEALHTLLKYLPETTPYIHPVLSDLICIDTVGPLPVQPRPVFILIDPKCGEAVLRGSHIYCPGLLASSCNCKNYSVPESTLVSVYCAQTKILRGTKMKALPRDLSFLGNGLSRMVNPI